MHSERMQQPGGGVHMPMCPYIPMCDHEAACIPPASSFLTLSLSLRRSLSLSLTPTLTPTLTGKTVAENLAAVPTVDEINRNLPTPQQARPRSYHVRTHSLTNARTQESVAT